MSYHEPDGFQLPEISIVGGTTEQLVFHLWSASHDAIGLTGSCMFAITSFIDPNSTPVVIKTMTISADASSGINNVATVSLGATDTRDLEGKYVYQITLKSASDVDVQQGILYVARNRHRAAIS